MYRSIMLEVSSAPLQNTQIRKNTVCLSFGYMEIFRPEKKRTVCKEIAKWVLKKEHCPTQQV